VLKSQTVGCFSQPWLYLFYDPQDFAAEGQQKVSEYKGIMSDQTRIRKLLAFGNNLCGSDSENNWYIELNHHHSNYNAVITDFVGNGEPLATFKPTLLSLMQYLLRIVQEDPEGLIDIFNWG